MIYSSNDGGILEGERLGGGVVADFALDARDGGEVGAVFRGNLHASYLESVLLYRWCDTTRGCDDHLVGDDVARGIADGVLAVIPDSPCGFRDLTPLEGEVCEVADGAFGALCRDGSIFDCKRLAKRAILACDSPFAFGIDCTTLNK